MLKEARLSAQLAVESLHRKTGEGREGEGRGEGGEEKGGIERGSTGGEGGIRHVWNMSLKLAEV